MIMTCSFVKGEKRCLLWSLPVVRLFFFHYTVVVVFFRFVFCFICFCFWFCFFVLFYGLFFLVCGGCVFHVCLFVWGLFCRVFFLFCCFIHIYLLSNFPDQLFVFNSTADISSNCCYQGGNFNTKQILFGLYTLQR